MQAASGTPTRAASAPDTTRALSASLHRLARLRDMMPGDWSDGPQSLLTWTNRDGEDAWGEVRDLAPEPAPSLRGRFESADPLPHAAPDDDEISVAVAFCEDKLVQAERVSLATPEELPEPIEPAYGSIPDLTALLAVEATEQSTPEPQPLVTFDDTPAPYVAFGSAPLVDVPAPVVQQPSASPRPETASAPEPLIAPGACADVSVLLGLLAEQSAPAPAPADLPPPAEEEAPALAFGALPGLSGLIDTAPLAEPPLVIVREFDPQSLVDDALADACEGLLAPTPIAPDDSAWDVAALPADATAAHHLAAAESALWNLPPHVPCLEVFQSNPNHETAVKLTRALRLRAHALEARAFAESVDFGGLQCNGAESALWFPADALATAPEGGADLEASLADWVVNEDGLVVVVAPGLHAAPPVARPLITEAELDALLERVEDSQKVVQDDLGDEERWSEPYWSDVDSYLARVSDAVDAEYHDASYSHPSVDMHDIEIRDAAPEDAAPATHFWMPGDDDITVAGDGDDLFVVCGADQGGVVLVEDGATWSMRTGGAARMEEIVVSLSQDPWRDVDSMAWRRIATLSGVGSVRIEQNARASRRAVMMGAFTGSGLDEEAVRLLRTGDDGEEEFPVMRPMSLAPFAELH